MDITHKNQNVNTSNSTYEKKIEQIMWVVNNLGGVVPFGKKEVLQDGTIDTSRCKKPLWKGWTNKAIASEAEIRNVWKFDDFGYNVALVTGDIIVIDCDDVELSGTGKPNGLDTLRLIEKDIEPLPPTLKAFSSKGFHLFFKNTSGKKITVCAGKVHGQETAKMDVRGLGGAILVAPSIHPSGDAYRFEDITQPVAELPESWAKFLSGEKIKEIDKVYSQKGSIVTVKVDGKNYQYDSARFGEKPGQRLKEGSRNAWLFSKSLDKLKTKLDYEYVLEVIQKLNQKWCDPPLEESEVTAIVASSTKYVSKTRKLSKVEKLSIIFEDNDWEVFIDNVNNCWVVVNIEGHYENLGARSEAFIQLCQYKLTSEFSDTATPQQIDQFIQSRAGAIRAGVVKNQPIRRLEYRSYFDESKRELLVDSGRDDWSFYRITKDGWTLEQSNKGMPFKRYNDISAFECDEHTKRTTWDEFSDFLYISDKRHQDLARIWLGVALFSNVSRPGILLSAEHGSGKSDTARALRSFVDPTKDEGISLPNDPDELSFKLEKAFCPLFDNVSYIPDNISDVLCQATTSGSYKKRKLYTDEGEISWTFKRTYLITSTTVPGNRADFLSRAFVLNVGRKTPQSDSWVSKQLKKIRPGMQALIFDCISASLKRRGEAPTKSRIRLSEAYSISMAMADALGLSKDRVKELWEFNHDEQEAEVINAEPIFEYLRRFVEDRPGTNWTADNNGLPVVWKGTAQQLMDDLHAAYEIRNTREDKKIPKTGNQLTRKLNKNITLLKDLSIECEYRRIDGDKNDKRGVRGWVIQKTSTENKPNGLVNQSAAKSKNVVPFCRTICRNEMAPIDVFMRRVANSNHFAAILPQRKPFTGATLRGSAAKLTLFSTKKDFQLKIIEKVKEGREERIYRIKNRKNSANLPHDPRKRFLEPLSAAAKSKNQFAAHNQFAATVDEFNLSSADIF